MKPLVKWAGGKTQLLGNIIPLMPEQYNRYFEVFVGGGALYFAVKPKKAVLNDFNPQLINLYEQCKNSPNELKNSLDLLQSSHKNTKEYYEQKRKEFNECLANNELSLKSASLMLYLNKSGFNGLYRLNSNGLYNVPSGHKNKVSLYEENNLFEVSKQLKHTKLLTGDFEKACKTCKKGDFVFFDSPYYNTFDTYQANGFSEKDHIRLRDLFVKLTNKGVYCLLTNSNEPFIKELYKDFNIEIIKVKRMINCDGNNRTGEEVIITNYKKGN